MKRFEVFVLLLAVGTICSVARAQEKKIRRDQLPAAVEKSVAAESQGATIKGFSTEVEAGRRLYEVEMMVNGHHKDVSMDRNGVIVEAEEEVSMDSLPESVQAALKKAAGSGQLEMIESLTKNGKLVAYEGHVKHGVKRSEIQVGPQGEKLKRPE
jgi:uncharacterized membrane protein YkoI